MVAVVPRMSRQLHPQCRTMHEFCGKDLLNSAVGRVHFLEPRGLTAGISGLTSSRLEIRELGKRVVKRSSLVANPPRCCKPRRDLDGQASVTATSRDKENSGCYAEELDTRARNGGLFFTDDVPLNVKQWRLEVETLFPGDVGKYAFLATLLLGVGVGCLTNTLDAEAATSATRHGALDVDMRALALGPEGPLLEEFWDNMRRYGLYFLTVVTGGLYTLLKPAIDLLRNPVTAVLVIIVVTGSIYLVSLTVSAMLGINEFKYDYAV